MSALTLRLPDDKHERLRALAQNRGTSVNRLLDEMTTLLLAEYDAETRFRIRTQRGVGQAEHGLALLEKASGKREDFERHVGAVPDIPPADDDPSMNRS